MNPEELNDPSEKWTPQEEMANYYLNQAIDEVIYEWDKIYEEDPNIQKFYLECSDMEKVTTDFRKNVNRKLVEKHSASMGPTTTPEDVLKEYEDIFTDERARRAILDYRYAKEQGWDIELRDSVKPQTGGYDPEELL